MGTNKSGMWAVWCVVLACVICFGGCGGASAGSVQGAKRVQVNVNEPETLDFQHTTIGYTVPYATFDRLVGVSKDAEDAIVPSLADSWEVSDDGLHYVFHLREGVKFSNGSELTATDVRYTFERLIRDPESTNRYIVSEVEGADELERGEADSLAGFDLIDDYTFSLTLKQPFSAFLASLAMAGASIMDEQTVSGAEDRFGVDPEVTVGTGPYILSEWVKGDKIVLVPNPACWSGLPANTGIDLVFVDGAEALAERFKAGALDVLNVDELGYLRDYYLRGDIYADRLHSFPQVAIDYIALNESVKPLDDVRVRKALQLALDRPTLLDASYSGDGTVEHGIFPHGLIGHNDDLEEIPYDPDEAKRLLEEAGYADGFELDVSLRASTPSWQRDLMDMAQKMWDRVGVKANINIVGEDEFMAKRNAGELVVYTATWTADYDDPDNFIYTFFGNEENTRRRSLCYTDEEAMGQVRNARTITDEDERIEVYHELEKKIVQEDAAWIPLFCRDRHYLVSDRVTDFSVAWNGWIESVLKDIAIGEGR